MTVLRQQLLEESSDIMELSEAFEQSESLTTRLKHVIGDTASPLPPSPAACMHHCWCPACMLGTFTAEIEDMRLPCRCICGRPRHRHGADSERGEWYTSCSCV